MTAINTEWDFVEPSADDVLLIIEQAKESPHLDLVVRVDTHAAMERVSKDGDSRENWLLTARILLMTPKATETHALVTAADFRARVPCSGEMTVAEAKAKWSKILSDYLMNEWLPLYAEKGCDDEG